MHAWFISIPPPVGVDTVDKFRSGMGRDGKLQSIQEIKLGSCDIQEDCVLSLGMLFGKCTNMSTLDLGTQLSIKKIPQ